MIFVHFITGHSTFYLSNFMTIGAGKIKL